MCRRDSKAIERQVSGGAGVMGDDAGETEIKCGSHGSIDAHVAHHAADEQLANTGRF